MPTLFIFILPWKEEVCLYTGGVHNAAKCEGYKALLLWNGSTSFLSWLCLITHILFSKTRCIRKENQTWIYSKRIQDCSFHVLYHYEQNHGKLFLVTKYKNGKFLFKILSYYNWIVANNVLTHHDTALANFTNEIVASCFTTHLNGFVSWHKFWKRETIDE